MHIIHVYVDIYTHISTLIKYSEQCLENHTYYQIEEYRNLT